MCCNAKHSWKRFQIRSLTTKLNRRGRPRIPKILYGRRPRLMKKSALTDKSLLTLASDVRIDRDKDGTGVVSSEDQAVRLSASALAILEQVEACDDYGSLKTKIPNISSKQSEYRIREFLNELQRRGIIKINDQSIRNTGLKIELPAPQVIIRTLNRTEIRANLSDRIILAGMLGILHSNVAMLLKSYRLPPRTVGLKEVITTWIASAIFVLMHEFGHIIQMRANRMEIAQVAFTVTRFGLVSGRTLAGNEMDTLTKSERLAIILAGPVADSIVALAAKKLNSPIIDTLGFAIMASNLIPKGSNDGAKVVTLLKEKQSNRTDRPGSSRSVNKRM